MPAKSNWREVNETAKYRQIHVQFWSSPDVEKVSSCAGKLIFIYLFSNGHRNESCIYRITPKKISGETGVPIDEVVTALKELTEIPLIKYDWDEYLVWAINAVKYQTLNRNEVTSIRNDLSRIDHPFAREFETLHHDLLSPYEGAPKDLPKSKETPGDKGKGNSKGKDKESETPDDELPNKPDKVFDLDSIEYKLSDLLLTLIRENDPGFKTPNLQTWAKHIDLMLRVDKRKPEDIEAVIRFAQKDSFWHSNILSTNKLRDKYDQLNAKRPKPRGEPIEGEGVLQYGSWSNN